MADNQGDLETAVEAFLARESGPTGARVRELIAQFRPVFVGTSDDQAEQLARRLEARHSITMTVGSVLTGHRYEPWLDAARASIIPYYWDRYRKLLAATHFSGQVIATLDEVTERVLGLLENPLAEGSWDRRGLVVGHVQSGKTANYTGLICKAADAGYRIIVVIAGVHNNLRNQTQQRIDEGLIGRDSARLLSGAGDHFVGVGRMDRTRRPVTFTNSHRDFNKATASSVGIRLQNLNEPAVFVIKKNSNTLMHLLAWLNEHSAKVGGKTVDLPMLLIDDEADNASINIRYGQAAVAGINAQIRQLLNMFDRSCYVGYTATPFANIFIDPDTDDAMAGHDLFPRDFIVSLDPPSNYLGPIKMFLDEPDDPAEKRFIRYIEDADSWLPLKHKISATVSALPESLLEALRTFVVARAIRLARGHDHEHCSMLVNATRFTSVQRQIRNELHNRLVSIQASVRVNGALPPESALRDTEIRALQATWAREFVGAGFTWAEVQGQLHAAASPIKVVEVNSNASGTLNYKDHEKSGLNVIAVGGLSLSRGLTLHGLMVSYFLRNSQMYDTLMQMGRWFGYRPEYEDLCRIWMPEEAEGWYEHITESIEGLRTELRSMEAAGATPMEFGLKVRSHPDTLIVTARNKMGSGQPVVVSVGLGNNFIETAILRRDETSLKENREAAQRLASDLSVRGRPLSQATHISGGWLLRDAPVEPVTDFIGRFRNHQGAILTDSEPVRAYIRDRQESELARWDILIAGVERANDDVLVDHSLGLAINCQRREPGNKSDRTTLRITNKQRVASRGVEQTGLTPEQVRDAEDEYRKDPEVAAKHLFDSTHGSSARSLNYPDRIYRARRETPLLIIHLLKVARDPRKGHAPPDDTPSLAPPNESKTAIVAYSISFPPTAITEKKVKYVVNTTWLRENMHPEFDPEDMDADDD
jgi:hypothetical protein